MTLIGIISDIHGDIEALNRVLELFENVHQLDDIICAGDLTGYGQFPNEVIEAIRKHHIPTVKGNHDSPSADITSDNADFLRKLPLEWRDETQGIRIYMCHGRPGIPYFGFIEEKLTTDEADMVLTTVQADILITAHTHRPMVFCSSNGCFINAGSVYAQSTEGTSRTYGVLNISERSFSLFDVSDNSGTPIKVFDILKA